MNDKLIVGIIFGIFIFLGILGHLMGESFIPLILLAIYGIGLFVWLLMYGLRPAGREETK